MDGNVGFRFKLPIEFFAHYFYSFQSITLKKNIVFLLRLCETLNPYQIVFERIPTVDRVLTRQYQYGENAKCISSFILIGIKNVPHKSYS